MSTKPQKLDRETNAAYAASQPLFDALRNATNKAGDQKVHLAKARDTVQKLHVKLVDTNNADDVAKHEQYVHHVMKAWTSATEVYCSIFDELCKITAADPTEGREASERYGQFKAMAKTAGAAKTQAMSYRQAEGATTPRSEATPAKSLKRTRQDNGDDIVGDAAARAEKGPRKRKMRERRPVILDQATTGAGAPFKAEDNAANVRGADNDPTPVEKETAGPEPEPLSAGKENVPLVEYEDVSAEVAARLKAKEERKKLKKEEKKRKRESGDSGVVEGAIAEKPSKKRSKVEDTNDLAEGGSHAVAAKRKSESAVADAAGASPRKRKKSKA